MLRTPGENNEYGIDINMNEQNAESVEGAPCSLCALRTEIPGLSAAPGALGSTAVLVPP